MEATCSKSHFLDIPYVAVEKKQPSEGPTLIRGYRFDAPHVLVVSASKIDREDMVQEFADRSWRVTEAESCGSALAILNLNTQARVRNKIPKIDLVYAHHYLGELPSDSLNGHKLLNTIKGSPTTMDLPVVIMASNTDHATINRFRAERAAAYYSSPITGGDVKKLVRMLHFPTKYMTLQK